MGIVGNPHASRETLIGLTLLQHRGQDSAGILTFDETGFHYVRDLGLVEQVFTSENSKALTGSVALGHVRYSTSGKSELRNVQPFLINYPYGIGMVHNGNLINTQKLTNELKSQYHRQTLSSSDTEVILNLFAEGISRSTPKDENSSGESSSAPTFEAISQAVEFVFSKAIGSYSIVTLIAGYGLVAFRDPQGIRPLVYGKKNLPTSSGVATSGIAATPSLAYLVASESSVLDFLDYETVGDVEPGEVLAITLEGRVHRKKISLAQPQKRPCMFEWVYFASAQSKIESTSVYNTRMALGRKLALKVKKEIQAGRMNPDVVIPIPESARIASIALSEELHLPYREVLIKNRYISRTFILDNQEKREKAVRLKLAPVVSELKNKRVILVDDSIVRGTTSKKLIEIVRSAGAKEVYFVSTCPPIEHPCFYGIDFPEKSELIAYQKTHEQIEKDLGADRVVYQDLESLLEVLNPHKPCVACITGQYPTTVTDAQTMIQSRQQVRKL